MEVKIPEAKIRKENKTVQEDDLSSERNIDYTHLRDLLKARNWQQADIETHLLMIRAVGRREGDKFTAKEILNFPCTDLQTIDRLWVKYSNGKFGFSVQKKLYLGCGGTPTARSERSVDYNIWTSFSKKVGWLIRGQIISYSKVNFSTSISTKTSAPQGHLPFGVFLWGLNFWGGDSTVWIELGEVFFFRVISCGL